MQQSSEQLDNFTMAEKILVIFANVFSQDPLLMGFELREQVEALFLGISRSGNGDTAKNQWMLQYMNYLVTNEMVSELKDLAICIVDFLQINTLDVCNKLFTNISNDKFNEANSQQYIKVLLQLTNFPLVPVLQEFFSVRMIDFWLELAECYSVLSNEMLKPNAHEISTEIFQQVINIYLAKISLINKQKILQDDTEDISAVHEFEDFRSAASDLAQTLWMILGHEHLTNILIAGIGGNDASSSKDMMNLFQIESMSFLLNVLLEGSGDTLSKWICNVIKENAFTIGNILLLLKTGVQKLSENEDMVALSLRLDLARTSCHLLGKCSGYFNEDSQQLGPSLETLFQGLESCTAPVNSLEATASNQKLETVIVRTITMLCETCRQQLSSFLGYFFTVLTSIMSPDAHVSTFTRSNLVRSIGYIIQSQTDGGPEQQAKYIIQVIDLISNFIEQNITLKVGQTPDQQHTYIHCLLECLSELGSALLDPDELADSKVLPRLAEFQQFWKNDPLQVRNKILLLIEKVLSVPTFSRKSDFIEVSCLILGKMLTLPDDEPHFLRYSMQEIIEFILRHVGNCELSTSLPYFVYLLEKLVIHFKQTLTSQEFDFLFEKIILVYYSQFIFPDPDLLQMTINFVNTILDTNPSILVHSNHWNSFIFPEFIKLLLSKEKFTIIAVNKFWTKVLNNKRYTKEDLEITRSQIGAIGQDLVYHIMYGLYHTQRSDLNSYTDVLRALVAKFPMETKPWLINVLPQLSDQPVVHERFINKLAFYHKRK